MKQRDTLPAIWLRAWLYMGVVGGGWLLVLPAALLFLEHGRLVVALRGQLCLIGGSALGAAGACLALAAGYHLIVHGRGTPLPLDPPTHLVTSGPYAYVRNPQAIAMALMAAGEILAVHSRLLWILFPLTLTYLALVGAWEERQLAARHAEQYLHYKRKVRKWLPNARPYRRPPVTPISPIP